MEKKGREGVAVGKEIEWVEKERGEQGLSTSSLGHNSTTLIFPLNYHLIGSRIFHRLLIRLHKKNLLFYSTQQTTV